MNIEGMRVLKVLLFHICFIRIQIASATFVSFYNAYSGERKVIIGNCCLNLKNSITLLELRGNFKALQLQFMCMCMCYIQILQRGGSDGKRYRAQRDRGNVIEYRSHTIMIYLPSFSATAYNILTLSHTLSLSHRYLTCHCIH